MGPALLAGLQEKRVRLTGDVAGARVPVRASVPELSRVLRNLLANAIRHTPADGSVHVRAHTCDGQGYVEVADACGGIPEQDLPRVFDVAFRGTAARTPGDDGGAGLGLAISRGPVHARRGEISIANAGAGCRVLVRIPAPSAAPGCAGSSHEELPGTADRGGGVACGGASSRGRPSAP